MVLVKVIEIKSSRQYSTLAATFQPVNLLYELDVNPSLYSEIDGNIIVHFNGLEAIFKACMDVVNEKPKTEF